MREQVTIVVKADGDTEEWEVMGVYVSLDDAENAIAYAERNDPREWTYAKVTQPVLTFPEWVK